MRQAGQIVSYQLNANYPGEPLMAKEHFFSEMRRLMPGLAIRYLTWRMWDAYWQAGYSPEDAAVEIRDDIP